MAQSTLIEFRPLVRNSLRGFATVELPSGLRIMDITVHNSHGKVWASLPSKPQIDGEGRIREADGKRQYTPVLAWKNRDLADGFSQTVCDLVREQYPKALD